MMKKNVLEAALREAEAAMRALSATHKPGKWLAKNYVGAGLSRLDFLDVKIPLVRGRFKQGFSFSRFDPAEQWLLWDHIWRSSKTFETMLLSSYWAARRPLEELTAHAGMIFDWVAGVDNWAHSDEMSFHCARILETNHRLYMPTFEKWADSENPWERRQSLVGLLYYSRSRKKVPSFATMKRFIERQMDDDHFYVQKGVGWTLRETWNVYPSETESYLLRCAHRIPPAGWTAATEKLSPTFKAKLTRQRKDRRR